MTKTDLQCIKELRERAERAEADLQGSYDPESYDTLRNHAERLAEALELYADMPHRDGCECEACAALAAYRKATTPQEEA